MLEITYMYGMILGCVYVYRTLANDPEREKIWGSGGNHYRVRHKQPEFKEEEFEEEPSREESVV